jgi:hypothetical protein
LRSDPRIGLVMSLVVAGLGLGWLVALAMASDDIFGRLGMGMHAVTFIAVFLVAASLATAQLFRTFLRVRDDLLAGRDVLARWHVDRETWERFSGVAEQMDRREKRGILLMIWVAVLVICGGLAAALPRDAAIFAAIGAGIAAMVGAAFLIGRRIHRSGHIYRTGEVIVGRRGLIVNGMLHVWGVWLSWLVEARVENRPVPMLQIAYAWWTLGFGPQGQTVLLPLAAPDLPMARQVAAAIARPSRGARVRPRRGQSPGGGETGGRAGQRGRGAT